MHWELYHFAAIIAPRDSASSQRCLVYLHAMCVVNGLGAFQLSFPASLKIVTTKHPASTPHQVSGIQGECGSISALQVLSIQLAR